MKAQILKWSFLIFLSFNHLYGGQNKTAMLQDISTIKGVFDIKYAPIDWKKENDNWDLENEYQKALAAVSSDKEFSLKEFQQLIRKFMYSSMDHHVGILFYSTEKASLPFRVRTADQHTYVDWIDPIKLSKDVYALRVGDEILEFDGKPIAQVLEGLHDLRSKNSNPLTEIALTDANLTKRKGEVGDTVPKGPMTVTFRSHADGKIKTNQFMWEYFPELIKAPSNLMQTTSFFIPEEKEKKSKLDSKYSLFNEVLAVASDRGKDDGSLGSRISFVPTLGKVTWVWNGKLEDEKEEEGSKHSSPAPESNYPMWNAYIYENEEGRSIGYIRIPHYMGESEDIVLFGKIIGYMEKQTEALVVDQVNNFGGRVNFLYDLASMLTPDYMKTPKHSIKITQEDVYDAVGMVDYIDMLLSKSSNLHEVLKFLGQEDEDIDYQKLLFMKYFYQFITEEWNAGRDFTLPTYIDGVDIINPHPSAHYSKPILILVNELDFSCGDFLPAILQDNKRATVFGTQTSGAGGFIKTTSFPNKHGIMKIGYTASLAERETQKKIESLGVSPDIEYKITGSDIQNRYVNYGIKVNEVIASLLPPKKVKTVEVVEVVETIDIVELKQTIEEILKLLEQKNQEELREKDDDNLEDFPKIIDDVEDSESESAEVAEDKDLPKVVENENENKDNLKIST